jgi:hypothetical protein
VSGQGWLAMVVGLSLEWQDLVELHAIRLLAYHNRAVQKFEKLKARMCGWAKTSWH